MLPEASGLEADKTDSVEKLAGLLVTGQKVQVILGGGSGIKRAGISGK